jgi:hypothetical protein
MSHANRAFTGPSPPNIGSLDSPLFSERPQFGEQRPCRPVLTIEVPKLVGNGRRLHEEIVRRLREALAHGRRVDHRVDEHACDVNTARSEFASNGFGEDELRGLCRRETAKFALPRVAEVLPVTRMVRCAALIMAGASSRVRCSRPMTFTRKLASSVLGSISRKVPRPPRTAFVNENARRAETIADVHDRFAHLSFIGRVALLRMGVRKLPFEHGSDIRRPGESAYAEAVRREPPHDRSAGAGTDTRYRSDGFFGR